MNAIYIDDEYTFFAETLIDRLKKAGIDCKHQDWSDLANGARVSANTYDIDFKKLVGILEKYDTLLINDMMSPEGVVGT